MSTGKKLQNQEAALTPREIVAYLDRYIVGQGEAKKAVAIALRNRWRRKMVDPELADEILPKNIIMMGPTGVGKTEIARRLAKLANLPFLKIEASKFTEVGYVGRDVDSMARDLMETAVGMVRREAEEQVKAEAKLRAENRILDNLSPTPSYEMPEDPSAAESASRRREKLRQQLRNGTLDSRTITISVKSTQNMPMMEIFSNAGMEEMGFNLRNAFGNAFPDKEKDKEVAIGDALTMLEQEEAQKLVDDDAIVEEARQRVEQSGIIFLDEVDKVAGREGGHGPDISREGVQRDLLPIIEGTTVATKYGPVKTDHILFIAAGAFHVTKPADLIPELQGRFPIRVELSSLNPEDFKRILVEPENSLIKQYTALLHTESVFLEFTDDALECLAQLAAQANNQMENIGARRLYTLMEKLLEHISFEAPDMTGGRVVFNREEVEARLRNIIEDQDMSRYVL
jgi:ATP-dependent HslUV protease ATP-binding subunit HslU